LSRGGGGDLSGSEAATTHRLSLKGKGVKKWWDLSLRAGGGGGMGAGGVARELATTTVAAWASCR
jgi:hypothetical protein